MEKENINTLLDRYFNGETTLEQEQSLRDYFAGSDVAPVHEPLKPLFTGLAAMSEQDFAIPQGLEEEMSRHIDDWDAPSQFRFSPILRWVAAACVAAAVAIAGWLLLRQQPVQQLPPVIAERVEKPDVKGSTPAKEVPALNEPATAQLSQPAPPPAARANETLPLKHKSVTREQRAHIPLPQEQEALTELSPEEQEIAMAALNKMSRTLAMGYGTMDETKEKIDNITNILKRQFDIDDASVENID